MPLWVVIKLTVFLSTFVFAVIANRGARKEYKMLKSESDVERRKTIWKTFDARARSIEEPFFKSMNKAFTKQNELVDKTIKEAVKNNKDVVTEVIRLYDKEMDEALKHSLAGAFINGLTVGAEHGQSLIGKKAAKEISEEYLDKEDVKLNNLFSC